MTIVIPENKFEHPTEAREEVVQLLCNGLLRGYSFWAESGKAVCFVRKDGERGRIPFWQDNFENACIRFHECEMNAAFSALREAGYHIFRSMYPGRNDLISYECKKEDYSSSDTVECEELHPLSHWD